MEKYCPKCNKLYDDFNANYCSNCATRLRVRENKIDVSDKVREKIFKRDGYRCQICGVSKYDENITLEIDYIVPIDQGGSTESGNLHTICQDCLEKSIDLPILSQLNSDINSKKDELKLLKNFLIEDQDKLEKTHEEDELIDLKFEIIKLKEDISKVEKEISRLNVEYQNEIQKRQAIKLENEKKVRLFKKLYITLSDNELDFLTEYYSLSQSSKEGKLKYLCENYNGNQIKNTLKVLTKKYSNKMTKRVMELLYDKLSFKGSEDELITFIVKNYDYDEFKSLINVAENDLADKLSATLDDKSIRLLRDKFSSEKSNDELIRYLVRKYSENEIFDLVNSARKDLFTFFDNVIYDEFEEYLNETLPFKGSRFELINYIIDNYQKQELMNIRYSFKTFNNLVDKKIEVLLVDKLSFEGCRNELISFLINNYSKSELIKLINSAKDDLFDEWYGIILNDFKDFLLIRFSFKFKVDLIDFLMDNYSLNEILDLKKLFEDLNEKITESIRLLLCENLSIELSKLELINYLIDHFTKKDMLELIDSTKKELFKKIEDDLNPQVALNLSEKFEKHSKKELIDYLIKKYSKNEIDELIDSCNSNVFNMYKDMLNEKAMSLIYYKLSFNKSQEDLLSFLVENYSKKDLLELINNAKKELIDDLKSKIDDILLKRLCQRNFFKNCSKEFIVDAMIEKFTVEEIWIEINHIKKDLRNEFFDRITKQLDDKLINALCKKYSLENCENNSVVNYLIDNFLENEIFEEIESAKIIVRQELFDKVNETLDEEVVKLYWVRFNLEKCSKELVCNYLVDNFTEEEIFNLVEIKNHQLFQKLNKTIDNKMLPKLCKKVSYGQRDKIQLISYLLNNYTVEEIEKEIKWVQINKNR